MDEYTSWQLIKPTPSAKIRQILQGQLLQFQFFISGLNKSNDNKLLYLVDSVLQNWAAL